ncbi:hypothetical protein BpHYR1_018959 [Brachionus plicatilis]|uniref:Uncharacterized protein n=1 Tax=Brachionus plicatilis TaxID=10195 RepID=A0A3M7QN46_BRAPC|nr:hypothetical protein BpHYR1_018959 [Brachionus plicatilis]
MHELNDRKELKGNELRVLSIHIKTTRESLASLPICSLKDMRNKPNRNGNWKKTSIYQKIIKITQSQTFVSQR